MKVFESKRARRLVVRLDTGEDLVEALLALAEREGVGAAWVRGIGSLAWAELDRHDQGRKKAEPPQRFDSTNLALRPDNEGLVDLIEVNKLRGWD